MKNERANGADQFSVFFFFSFGLISSLPASPNPPTVSSGEKKSNTNPKSSQHENETKTTENENEDNKKSMEIGEKMSIA